jgi:proteasome beta subunit
MTDLPLSVFGAGDDPGASFTDLLRQRSPHLLPGATVPSDRGDSGDRSLLGIPHGTTIVTIRFADGVLMAGDRRATEGHSIANRSMDKVYPADASSVVGIAGAAGPAMEMVRLFATELEHYEKVSGGPLSLEGKANKLSQMIRANLPAAFQGLVVVPLFSGFDQRRGRGRVFRYDITGGRYEEADYATTGSGGVHARNWIKAFWREGLDRDSVIDLSLASLFQAADEDSATGGPDLIRRIYPSVVIITEDGIERVAESELADRAGRLVDTPALGGGHADAPIDSGTASGGPGSAGVVR